MGATTTLGLLLAVATQAAAPVEAGASRASELVEIVRLDSGIRLDIRYATANNFVGRSVYPEARAFLQRPAAEALVRAHRALRQQGYGLLVFDAYRPWRITKLFWEVVPEDKRPFVADPRQGSKHNRGCAVDLSLYRLDTGAEVTMPSPYDDFSEKAHPEYAGAPPEQRRARARLRAAMEQQGFEVEPNEWWHFNYRDLRSYPILDVPFDAIGPPSTTR